MRQQPEPRMGIFIAIGAGIGVAFMPMLGPLALAIGAGIGVVLGAIVDVQAARR